MFAVVFHAATTVWMTVFGVVLLFADWQIQDDARWNAALDCWFIGVVNMISVVLGWQTLAQRRWAIYLQALIATAWTSYGIAQLVGVGTKLGDSLRQEGPERFTVHWMMTTACILELVLFAAAIFAYHANRPGAPALIWHPPAPQATIETPASGENVLETPARRPRSTADPATRSMG